MTLPNGFSYADRLQAQSFAATGSINGASKVTVIDGEVACRLRPPRDWPDAMVLAYKEGFKTGKANEDPGPLIRQTDPFIAGYRDAAEGRMKWHLAYCADHGDHESGCQA